jgi:hypothetical protein
MIVNAIIALVTTLVGAAFSLLPTSSINVLEDIATSFGDNVQGVGHWDGFFPVLAMLQVIATVLTILLPGILLYKLLNWLYKHIPQIGGFGPGSG